LRVLDLEQQLTNLRGTFGEAWPAVVEKRDELALVRRQLEQEEAAVLARSLEQARLDLEAADARRRLVQRSLDEEKVLVNQFHDASIEYNILKREVDTNRNLYDGLLERFRQTGVFAGLQFGNIRIVEPGRPSAAAYSPNVAWNLGLATVLGLSLGVCMVLLRHSWDTSISTLEDVEELAPLPSLGSVPLIKGLGASTRASLLPASASEPLEQYAPVAERSTILPFELRESIGSICASILLSRSNARPRVIVVTSATHAEGKTTLVTHLGGAFAEAGMKTLLVEADLRKPDLSKAFSITNKNGLSLYLAGLVPYKVSIQETSTKNLFLASGGPVPPNPAGLLHSDRLTSFLGGVASEYDLVILDAPPVLSLADARILSSKSDGVILVVRAGQTAKTLVRRACAAVEQSGANLLGMVLNGWKPDRTELSQYRYYEPVA
jgi:capsular exopolysaccharide synthesis family protein